MDKTKKMDNFLEKTAEKLTGIVDVNTVIGKPLQTASGAQVIPFTKVTMGYLTGGGEYGDVKKVEENECLPFAGGAGTVVNVKPAGCLIDDGKECRVVRITDDALDGVIERAGDIIARLLKKGENA